MCVPTIEKPILKIIVSQDDRRTVADDYIVVLRARPEGPHADRSALKRRVRRLENSTSADVHPEPTTDRFEANPVSDVERHAQRCARRFDVNSDLSNAKVTGLFRTNPCSANRRFQITRSVTIVLWHSHMPSASPARSIARADHSRDTKLLCNAGWKRGESI